MVKNIGKPCVGKSHARFDEGRLVNEHSLLTRSSRVRQGVPKVLTATTEVSFLLYHKRLVLFLFALREGGMVQPG